MNPITRQDPLLHLFTETLSREALVTALSCHHREFTVDFDPSDHLGCIKRLDLPQGASVFVRADLHGDLKSLIANLQLLIDKGLLDKNLRCAAKSYLVFLGDFMDRGRHSLHVLALLARLHAENRGHVFLIRGNHEYLPMNQLYAQNDPELAATLDDFSHLLTDFYKTMPLSLYLGTENPSGPRQYVQFSHALFELYVDPSPILDSDGPSDSMSVPRPTRVLSERIQKMLALPPSKIRSSAEKVQEILAKSSLDETGEFTLYNWGDIGERPNYSTPRHVRGFTLTPQDIKHYLRVSGDKNSVKALFRGHQHFFSNYTVTNDRWQAKVIATTLPIGCDVTGVEPDFAFLLTTALKVREWTKCFIVRDPGERKCRLYPNAYPIYEEV